MNDMVSAVVTIATAIVGVAILAVLVSQNAQTATVIGSAGQAFGGALAAAEAPVTGGGMMGGYGTTLSGGAGYPTLY